MWQNTKGLLHSKKFLKWDLKIAIKYTNLNRQKLSILCGALTGHSNCKEHLGKIGVDVDPECRFCHLEPETTLHIIADCPALANKRMTLLGKPFLEETVTEFNTLPFLGLIELLKPIYEA